MSPTRAEKESRRARRATTRLSGADRSGTGECLTGHPALFAMEPAFALGRLPEGGGYPEGFVELAARLLEITDLADVVHLCSGSVLAPRTFDLRRVTPARVIADCRWLPIRPSSVRWVLADPPYDQSYAEAIWGLGVKYPTPAVLLREIRDVLVVGGRVGFLHHLVPMLPEGLERLGTWGVYCGAGTRMRAFTVAERTRAEVLA